MEEEIPRIVQAIVVASNPLQQDRSLQAQAVNYLNQVQQNAQADEVWQMALKLFIDTEENGITRKYDPQTRLFSLRILDDFIDNRFTPLSDQAFQTLKDHFIGYIQSEYVGGSAESSAPFLRNKFSHTFSLFFLCTYQVQWPTFFVDLFILIRAPTSVDSPTSTSTSPPLSLNPHISLLFFRIVLEISGEISDQLLKSARSFQPERHARDARVRDLVRERDAGGLNDAVVGIVTRSLAKLNETPHLDGNEKGDLNELVDWGVRAFASYIHWIDISLTCTPTTIQLLFSLLASSSTPTPTSPTTPLSIRLSTVLALQRMVAKGLKEPADKIELLRVLDLGRVLNVLEERTRLARKAESSDEEDAEEQYRESLGKLLSTLGLELLELAKEEIPSATRLSADQMLEELIPVTLRFVADEYDDTSSTTFPFLHGILLSYKRFKKLNTGGILSEAKRSYLRQLLEVLVEKSRWDENDDPFEMDEDERSQFEVLRRDIRTFLEAIFSLEPEMVTNVLCTAAINYFGLWESRSPMITWQHAELAVYLVLIFGEIAKGPSRGRLAFCIPPPPPLQPLVQLSKSDGRIRKPEIDYSQYELTPQGQMMFAMIRSNVIAFPHPNSIVSMQVFECAVRYPDFFKVRKECIAPVLEALIDTRGIHHLESSVRSRAYYLFQRFVKDQKNDISEVLAASLLNGIGDTLTVDTQLSTDESELPQDATIGDVLNEVIGHATLFDSQLYIFEAAGTLVSLLWGNQETQVNVFQSLINPIIEGIQLELRLMHNHPNPGPEDVAAVASIVKLHRDILTLGHIAKGFPELPQIISEGYILPPIAIFQQAVEAILLALDAMNIYKIIRDSARSSFARIMAPTGLTIARYIPGLMTRLLQHFEASEFADFMNFLGLLVHKLQAEMFGVLDELIGPLHNHITTFLSQPIIGTDDKLAQLDTKKAYMSFLNSVASSKLHTVFTSERNKGQLESLLELVMAFAQDVSDSYSEKLAFIFLGKCIAVWAQPPSNGVNGSGQPGGTDDHAILGFEQFIYERIVPLAFKVPSLSDFNVKDGQMITICYEIANLIQIICKTRGEEAYNYLSTVFFPGIQCPPDTAKDFLYQARNLDGKAFRKYFTDFVRAAKMS